MGHETTAQSPMSQLGSDNPDGPAPRQCGRCRGFFSIAPSTDPTLEAKWWVCPACRAKFFGTP
ncbi:MAG TPA: hypothetical protein VNV87_14655 [Acidimicrobiales bacterium]|nr:hypothetical protein [Acidimicrobiales bacterium]